MDTYCLGFAPIAFLILIAVIYKRNEKRIRGEEDTIVAWEMRKGKR